MSNNVVKVCYFVSTDKVGSKCSEVLEYDRDEWDRMSPDERELEMKGQAMARVNWGWEER
jgi:hypothetical protein